MDRYDEAKHIGTDTHDEERTGAEGDVPGITRAPVPKAPGDPTTSDDPESVRRRRERASGADDTQLSDRTGEAHGHGATGIDMGYGGTGTDVSGE